VAAQLFIFQYSTLPTSGARLHQLDYVGSASSRPTQDTFYNQDDLLIREEVFDSRLGGSVSRVLRFFLWILRDKIGRTSELTLSLNLRFDLRLRGYIPYGMRFSESHLPYGSFVKTTRVLLKAFKRKNSGTLGNYSRRL
jgi:hypothetical protein